MPRSNVVITGSGVISSIGIGSGEFFQSLLEKQSGITSLADRTDGGASSGSSCEPAGLWIGGPITGFEPKQYVRPRKALKVMCREITTSFAASQLAIQQAGLGEAFPADPSGDLKPQDIGTVFGTEMFFGPAPVMEDAIRGCTREDGTFDEAVFGNVAMKTVEPLWMLKYLPNMPACHVGIALGAQGPNNTLVLGDVSGPAAVIEAASCIQRGIAKLMITAGTGSRINTTRMNYRGDAPIPQVYDPIEHSSRPHDPESTGVVGGEGAAALVLESLQHASQRGVKPIARLVSHASRFVRSEGMTRATRTSKLSDPGARGSAEAIRMAIDAAIKDAEIPLERIGLVVSHGTGDPVIDLCERKALAATVPDVPAVATIASLGHTGAACGTIDLATGALAIAKGVVPPTIRTDSTSREVAFQDRPQTLEGDYVLCVSHTSEGNATAIILGAA
jgi:3-oxoacyl-[acyl-carrier-protein] synthase II